MKKGFKTKYIESEIIRRIKTNNKTITNDIITKKIELLQKRISNNKYKIQNYYFRGCINE